VRAEAVASLPRHLFLAVLAALAAVGRGAPSSATLLALAALLVVFLGARALAERMRAPHRALRPQLLLLCALLAAAAVTRLLGATGGVAVPWVTLFGIPLALALALPGGSLVPRPRLLAALFYGALAVGLLAIDPWRDPVGRILVALLAVVGTVAAALDAGRNVVPDGLPSPPQTRRRTASIAALLALLALLTSLGVDAALAPIPRLWQEPQETPEREDRLAQQVQAAPADDEGAGERALALVRLVDAGDEPPQRLYLRSRLLDDPTESTGFVYLAPRAGEATRYADRDDGSEDLRIHWPETHDEGRGDERGQGITFSITLLADARDPLLVVPTPRWIEGRSLSIGADGAIAGPSGSERSATYDTAGDPLGAFDLSARRAGAAARDEELMALPGPFDGRHELVALLGDLREATPDAVARASAIAAILRKTGRFDPKAPFRDWAGFVKARRGSALHFAQCFALLARLARIPARVAMGYACDEYDAEDRRFDVRAKDFHYWGEVKIEGLGWIDFDPCPELPFLDPAAAAAGEPPPEPIDPKAIRKAIARERPFVVGLLLLLLVVAWLAFPSLRLQIDKLAGPRAPSGIAGAARRAWRFWQELLECCRRFGLEAHPAQTAEEFALVVGSAAPHEKEGVFKLLRVYHACRFGGAELHPEDERTSRELLARLPPALQAWRSERAAPEPSRR